MEALSTEMRYKKMSGFATTKGQMFEVKLSALLFLRGINSGLQFQLASNVAGAGALDDVVFRLKLEKNPEVWTTCFIQLKHKDNSRISCKMLTDPKGNFSLQKYCESFIEIKQAMSLKEDRVLFDGNIEDCTVIIYSNARANMDLGEGQRAALGSIEAYLESVSGNIFSFDPGRGTIADKAVSECLQKFGDDGIDFLRRVQIFCGQPNESELNSLIKDELRKVNDKSIRDVDTERLYECLLENVSVWCERSDFILHRDSDLLVRAWNRVIVETCSARNKGNYRLDVSFDDTALSSLREVLKDKFLVVNIESSESSSRLSFTKLLQAIEGSYLCLDNQTLLLHSSSVLSEWKSGRYSMLILVINDSDIEDIEDSYVNVLVQLSHVSVLSRNKIVILSHAMTSLKEKLQCLSENHTIVIKDSFEFSQIGIESQNKFLHTKFWLQGHSVSLESFMDGHCESDVSTAPCFVEITKSTSILPIGSEFTDEISYYIARTVTQTSTLTTRILNDTNVSASVLVTYSSTEDLHAILRKGDAYETNQEHFLKTLKKISEAPPKWNRNSDPVTHGEDVKLGRYTCSRAAVRHGLADQATALRIRPRESRIISNWTVFVHESLSPSDVDALKEPNTRHFLSLVDGRLEWIRSRTDSMEAIRDHVDASYVAEVTTEVVSDVKARLVLLCAEPGMGKSTLLARFAKKTKEALPNYWVILIALNDHTRLFAEGVHRDTLSFLVAALGIESRLQRSMLNCALHVTGNVVVLLDGFDEIAPKYVSECRLLLSSLLETKVKKIWITSRNSIKSVLEDHLSTLSSKLRKFTEADQRLFFRLYWRDERRAAVAAGKTVIDDDELDEFVGKLIEMTSSAISDREKDFMSIPLQTRMMAEVFVDNVVGASTGCVLPEKLDLLQLLDRFIEKKLCIYVQDKLKVKSSDTNYSLHLDVHRRAYVAGHMEAALVLILGDTDVGKLQPQSLARDAAAFFQRIGRGEDKTGIIDCVVNGKPRFIHRVFAEYFVARWFAENYAFNAAFLADNLYTPSFRVVRDILDRLLAVNLPLHTAILDENLIAVQTLLPSQREVRDLGGRTPLHLAAALGTDNPRKVAIVRAVFDETTNTDFPLGHSNSALDVEALDGVFDVPPLWYADVIQSYIAVDCLLRHGADPRHLRNTLERAGDKDVVDFAIANDLDCLVACWLDNGLGVEYATDSWTHEYSYDSRHLVSACEKGSVRVARLLIARGANVSKSKKTEEPPLHIASRRGHTELVGLLCDAHDKSLRVERVSWFTRLQNVLSSEPFTALLGNRGRGTSRPPWFVRVHHTLSAIFSWKLRTLWRRVESPKFVDSKSNDVGEETALHVAVRENRTDVIRLLIGRGAALRAGGVRGQMPLHVAACRSSETVRTLLDCVDDAERRILVNEVDSFGDTALHEAVGSLETLTLLVETGGNLTLANHNSRTPLMAAAEKGAWHIVEYIVDELTKSGEVAHIDARDCRGETALFLAAKGGFKRIVVFLIGAGAEFLAADKDGRTPLHAAVQAGETALATVLLDAVALEKRSAYANALTKHGSSPLALAVCSRRLKLVEVLVEAGAEVTLTNSDGETALMTAAQIGFVEAIDFFLKTFKDDTKRAAYVNAIGKQRNTALDCAFNNKHLDIVDILIANGADVETRTSWNGSTLLHSATKEDRVDIVRSLLAAAKDRATYVNLLDRDGETALHAAALERSLESARVLVAAGAKMAAQNRDGMTALMYAVSRGARDLVRLLLDEYSEEREGVRKVDYLSACNHSGKSAMDLARECYHRDAEIWIGEALREEGFVAKKKKNSCVVS